MRTVAPEVKAIEHPVEFLNRQDNRFVGGVWRCFESFGLQTLEPKAKAIALSVQDLHAVAWLVEEDEKYWIKDGDLDVQFDQCRQTVDRLSEVHGRGVQIHFFDFGIGSHHGELAPEGIGITAFGIS